MDMSMFYEQAYNSLNRGAVSHRAIETRKAGKCWPFLCLRWGPLYEGARWQLRLQRRKMRYPVIKPPTRQEQALIRRKIKEVVKAHGGLRAAARHLKIKRSYLSALLDGTKKNPGDWYLRKLGLRRVTYIEEI